jgi:hypothetical protein
LYGLQYFHLGRLSIYNTISPAQWRLLTSSSIQGHTNTLKYVWPMKPL